MKQEGGYIYILTNPSFPQYVKIGYADDVNERLKQLNRSECIPFAFKLYAYYQVNQRLTDLKIHEMIDKLNPNLRCIDTFNGKPRKKEFYAISKETAYNILQSIAVVSGTIERLFLIENDEENTTSEEAAEIDRIKYDISTYLSNKNEKVISLYKNISETILNKLEDTYLEATPNYIALRIQNSKTICELHLQRNRLLIQTRIPLADELLIGEKVPDTYLWTLNYRVYVYNEENIEKAVRVLMDVYNQINNR